MDLASLYPDVLGYLAAAAVFLTFCMRTMLTLRVVALASNLAFIAYALAAGLTPILVLHGALLPLNLLRLVQMQRLPAKLAGARGDDPDFSWLAPFGSLQRLRPGEVLCRKGDRAEAMYVIEKGELEVEEVGAVLGPGQLVGEIGLFAPDRLRTATLRARGPARISAITETQMRRLHYNNPLFAYRLTHLIAERLLHEAHRPRAEPVTSRRTSPSPPPPDAPAGHTPPAPVDPRKAG
ncbi:MAG: cyclic nucleotide-binding domain-containing protein [Pseudomonadota bacterium]